jgi:hypothetical protein
MAYGAVAMVVVGLLGASFFAPSYSECYESYQTQAREPDKYETQPHPSRTWPQIGWVWLVCEGEFLDKNGVVFTALFTIVLAASTILLWVATYGIASEANESSKTLISMERPYVTGGGDFENEWGKELFRLDVENHGKTAAFMTGYDLQFAKLADLQTEHPKVRPVCKNKFRHIDGISPQGARKEIRTQRRKPCADDVVFGAIYYRDIFDMPHHSRFILRIAPCRDVPGEGLTRLDVEGVSRDYWSWDIPKNEQA